MHNHPLRSTGTMEHTTGFSLLQTILLPLLLSMVSHGLAGAAAQKRPVMFIFGDSLSDVGNNNYLSRSLAKADLPWYGIDYANGMPTGRFTNGRTVIDIVAEKLGMPIPPAYLAPSTDADAALNNGVNYASGGGGILNETGWLFVQRLCLSKQIELFRGTKASIAAKIGPKEAESFFRGSQYLISIGSNDFINNYLLPVAPDAWRYSPAQYIQYLTSTLRQQLTTLHGLGARNVLFFGMGPLGCIPLQRILNSDRSCREGLNKWAVQFNAEAKKLLEDLNSQLPGAQFKFADGYPAITNLIQNPGAYGFNVSDTPCCTIGRYRPTLSCLPGARLCSDRSKYVFWDEYHPTDAANLLLADTLLSAMNHRRGGNSTHAKPSGHPPAAAPEPPHRAPAPSGHVRGAAPAPSSRRP